MLRLGAPPALVAVRGGQAAGGLVVDLMGKTQAKLPPDKIIQTYIDAGGKPNKTTFKALDDACGDATAELWLMGASTLARFGKVPG